MKIAHVLAGELMFVIVADQPSVVPTPLIAPSTFPVLGQKLTVPEGAGFAQFEDVAEYLMESAKYASSAVTRLRRSDFIEAMYAFSLVLANFGIAMAARMPMITTTISSSMSVKPFRFILSLPVMEVDGRVVPACGG